MHYSLQIRMLRVNSFECRRHLKLNLNAVAIAPFALKLCKLARLRCRGLALSIHRDRCSRPAHPGMRNCTANRLGDAVETVICEAGTKG